MSGSKKPGGNLLWPLLLILGSPTHMCAADRCSWRGSGLSTEPWSRTVEQVRLRCTEGTLEWLYPVRALRVLLEPNLAAGPTTVCIKPAPGFKGANVYVERAGRLQLLVNEADEAHLQLVRCFGSEQPQHVALFLQASPQLDLSRRTVAFQYELLSGQGEAQKSQQIALEEAMCRPCDNTQLLMAICSSDFVVRGSIKNVTHDSEHQMSQVEVSAKEIYRQKNRVFQQDEVSLEWTGPIKTLLQCRVKKGDGDFLFTGNEHFGDAWLGCAPRFKDFRSIYQAAREQGTNPCEFQLN
ncbi:meteorin-like protein [Microcaecilia unicolor]|uniref:Meteorin-like protein n=1 Tax=Microcaecilia unicolor TaxID=1415580 RepID=A0A6P7YCZ5_9AMPH|nr:meteorin-like protein [Microcaecilia unicolor]